jgi:lipid-binding SYLF domain-containing protein
MIRRLLTGLVLLLPVLATGCNQGTGAEQSLVDRATLTVQEMMTQKVSEDPRTMLERSKGALICPRIFKAGFFVGGEGGNCVLLARAGNGTWSYPAFYSIGSGSFGLQFGIEDNQLLLLIMTQKGLNATLDSQFKFGANAGIAVATYGAGVQGSTTTAVGADIIAFAASRGLFGGIALEGSVLSSKSESNAAYYGQALDGRSIVMQMRGSNPGAEPLREVLTRYGAQGAAPAATRQPAPQSNPGYAPAYPPYQPAPMQGAAPGGRGPIQEQTLAPPR